MLWGNRYILYIFYIIYIYIVFEMWVVNGELSAWTGETQWRGRCECYTGGQPLANITISNNNNNIKVLYSLSAALLRLLDRIYKAYNILYVRYYI